MPPLGKTNESLSKITKISRKRTPKRYLVNQVGSNLFWVPKDIAFNFREL